MDVVLIVLGSLAVLAFAVWAEFRLEIMEQMARSRDDHPAGRACADCGMRPADMDTHMRLAHAPRVTAPEDTW